MTEVHVVENDGSIYGLFSSYDLALDYTHRTKPYGGQWKLLKYVVDRLVPTGPFPYYDAYLFTDGSVYRTSVTNNKYKGSNENAITTTSSDGTPLVWGQSSTSLDEAIRLAKEKLASNSLLVDDHKMPDYLPHNV